MEQKTVTEGLYYVMYVYLACDNAEGRPCSRSFVFYAENDDVAGGTACRISVDGKRDIAGLWRFNESRKLESIVHKVPFIHPGGALTVLEEETMCLLLVGSEYLIDVCNIPLTRVRNIG